MNESTNIMSQKELYELLCPKYGSSLSATQTGKILNHSSSTLYRMRQNGEGPKYIKNKNKSDNSAIRYPLHEVVRYIYDTNNGGQQ